MNTAAREMICLLMAIGVTTPYGQSRQDTIPTSAENVCPLKPGMKVPNVSVADLSDNSVRLSEVVRDKRTVIIFYRGGWCPFCNLQLASLQGIESKLRDLGIQMLAISTDRPERLRESLAKHQLTYQLLSDSSMETSEAFGIAFRLDTSTVERYRSLSMDLEEASGKKHHLLPVPSVFLVDGSGMITFSYVNPNYRIRLDPGMIIALAESMSKDSVQKE